MPPRGRKAPAAAAVAPIADATPALSSPVVLDATQMTMGDLLTFDSITQAGDDNAAANALMPEVLRMLNRIVVGGIAHRPLREMDAVMTAVGAQIKAAGNPKA